MVSDDDALVHRVRVLRNHGIDPDAPTVEFVAAGFNLRMTEFQAALGITQFTKKARLIDGRRAAARVYDRLLSGTAVRPPVEPADSRHVYQSYVALLPPGTDRARVIEELGTESIQTTIGTYHIPLTRYFRERFDFSPGDFPVTDDVARRAITLPLYADLTEEDQRRVVATLLRHVDEGATSADVGSGTPITRQ
jgi:dTDP-4-amino-4,6-dideoxygalactose transaminase